MAAKRRTRRNPIGAALVSAARAILHAHRTRTAVHAVQLATGTRDKRRNPPTAPKNPEYYEVNLGSGRVTGPYTTRAKAKGYRRDGDGPWRVMTATQVLKWADARYGTVKRNPATMHAPGGSERLRVMSKSFHGRDDEIVHLGPDQRRVPPERVVLIGVEEEVTYRTHRHSERGGDDWTHEAGDTGGGKRRSGRRLIVADEDGRVYNVPGTSKQRFDPKRGLVG